MIGFITTHETADTILAGIEAAHTSRGLPHFWTVGKYPIYISEHAGKAFLPADDQILTTILHQGMTPMDFPECAEMLTALGGLEARQFLDPSAILPPEDT